jgi:hypothetical protein
MLSIIKRVSASWTFSMVHSGRVAGSAYEMATRQKSFVFIIDVVVANRAWFRFYNREYNNNKFIKQYVV